MPARDALIIACATYGDVLLQKLESPAQDARSLREVLADPAIGGFSVQELIDRPHYELTEAIEGFFHDRHPDDELLLYFSGHGIKDIDGQLFFAASDTRLERLLSTAVPSNLVNNAMQRSRSRCQILILDCCYSGAFARGMITKSTSSVDTLDHFQGTGRIILTASDATQYAIESESVTGKGIQSIFTEVLVHGLKTGLADRDRDGRVSVDELYDYTLEGVRARLPAQRPMKWVLAATGDLTIAKNPAAKRMLAPLPSALLSAIDDSTYLPIREAGVEQLGKMLNSEEPLLAEAAAIKLRRLLEDESASIRQLAYSALNPDRSTSEDQRPAPKIIDSARQQTIADDRLQRDRISTEAKRLAQAEELVAAVEAKRDRESKWTEVVRDEQASSRAQEKYLSEEMKTYELGRIIAEKHRGAGRRERERPQRSILTKSALELNHAEPGRSPRNGGISAKVLIYAASGFTVLALLLFVIFTRKPESAKTDVLKTDGPPAAVEMAKQSTHSEAPLQRADPDGTWTDQATGLMWSKTDTGKTMNSSQAAAYSQPRAIEFCKDLQLAGFDNWRLPTIAELEALYDPSASVKTRYPNEDNRFTYGTAHIKAPLQLSAPYLESISQDPRDDSSANDFYFDFRNGKKLTSNFGLRIVMVAACVRNTNS